MWLVVGLGNPGNKYALHRHNIGFMAVDLLAREYQASERTEHKALTYHITLDNKNLVAKSLAARNAAAKIVAAKDSVAKAPPLAELPASEKIIACKPQTFMNLSGDSIRSLCDFYKIDTQKVIVLHDEIDQPFATMKVQTQRGHGGHNGIRDTHEKLGHNKYVRLRLGVGRPADPRFEVADYVLSNFNKEEMAALPDFLNLGLAALETIIFKGYEKAANQFNGASSLPQPEKPVKPEKK